MDGENSSKNDPPTNPLAAALAVWTQDPKLSYSQVVARAEKTTKTLWTIVGALVLAALVILKLATGRII